MFQGVWTKDALKEHADPFGREVFDEDVPNDNHGSPKLELNSAVSWMRGVTGGNKEFLELERNSLVEYRRQVCNLPLLHFRDVAGSFAIEYGSGLDGNEITVARNMCLPMEVLGQLRLGIDLGHLSTRKKKRPKRRKKERKINQLEKAGIG